MLPINKLMCPGIPYQILQWLAISINIAPRNLKPCGSNSKVYTVNSFLVIWRTRLLTIGMANIDLSFASVRNVFKRAMTRLVTACGKKVHLILPKLNNS